ncbi:M20 family metallopeptidase [Sinanaerobacter chloroacetimidivorans]|uniref:M20/M25/M40 family metallo-hydrolase n=1 Tax=Sinanaerobacter chloroacetimidivorans TaxID=2818044 RepID=A0A8J7W4U9_9FIRM|nr:M20/M25/M40 family metallo-hydrolase [Sinanaerobacter chloroacetimidivorans]MBR0599220.1 M20/M25/M40 family metallo-hydrolase [Sinanaerobacter chloroacetimidivorans]
MINKTEVIDLMKNLISIPSPYFKEDRIMDFVSDWFINHNMDASFHEYHEAKVTGFKGKNILLELSGGEPGPTICLNGHLDTVKRCGGWTVDPFGGFVDGDRIYGVGALDMKSGCAAIMLALKAFTQNYKRFQGKILASFVSVEEGPYGMGTNALIEEGYLKDVDFSIVTEPSAGFTNRPFPVLCLGARGGFGLEIEFFGTSSHAALPQNGVSAALDAAKVICELEKVEYLEDEHLGKGSVCVVAVESDGGACSVPDYAKIKLFWHIVRGESENTIRNEIIKAIERAGIECRYQINFREAPSEGSKGFMPYTVSEEEPLVKTFVQSVKTVCKEEPAREYFQSIGDFNYLGSRLGAPVVIFGAEGDNFHSHDEYATLSSIIKTGEVIYDFLVRILVETVSLKL